MRLYRTADGLARGEGGELLLLDLPHRDVAALFEDDVDLARRASVRKRLPLDRAKLLSPVERPCRIIIVGLNYRGHVAEAGLKTPEHPQFIAIDGGPASGPEDSIVLPPIAPTHVDYEGEVGVVIGKDCFNVPAEEAWSYVGGLTCVNDVSARDMQRDAMSQPGQGVGFSKALDTFKPFGPAVVTVDAFTMPLDIALTTRVNGEVRQNARTSDLIFDIPQLIAAISRLVTLHPGDLICSGTPSGVGFPTGRYLKLGDIVEVEVEGIGVIRNVVAAHSSGAN
jgi:2-keto-4-pentenoate hydratase/2-oxohepta-3-ene-1,7-dioic acid hydratase in catechol pathway